MRKHNLTNTEISFFCSELSTMINAGISTYEALSLLEENTEIEKDKKLYHQIITYLDENVDFSEALTKTELFPQYMIKMISIGDESGQLDETLKALAIYYDKEQSIINSIKDAVTYPLIMSCMLILIILIIITKIMPIFQQIFNQMGSEINAFSKLLIGIGQGINSISLSSILILSVAIILLIYLCYKQRKKILNCIKRIKFINKINQKIMCFRFSNVLSMTLSSGLTYERGIELAQELLKDTMIADKIQKCYGMIDSGENFADSIIKSNIFEQHDNTMIIIGEKTGTLEKTMISLSNIKQKEVDESISKMISYIEPTIVITMSLVVGLILFSVMMPLIKMLSATI